MYWLHTHFMEGCVRDMMTERKLSEPAFVWHHCEMVAGWRRVAVVWACKKACPGGVRGDPHRLASIISSPATVNYLRHHTHCCPHVGPATLCVSEYAKHFSIRQPCIGTTWMTLGDHWQVTPQTNDLPLETFFRSRLVHISQNALFHSIRGGGWHILPPPHFFLSKCKKQAKYPH